MPCHALHFLSIPYLLLAQANFGKESRQQRKIGSAPESEECDGSRGKEASGKIVTKWTNFYGAVGKWKSVDLENGWIVYQLRLSQGKVDKPNPFRVRVFVRALSHFCAYVECIRMVKVVVGRLVS
jgi:hypothetical protein